MREINKLFGIKIRKAREKHKLSQQELAERVDLGRTAITNIELGKQGTTIETLFRLGEALETSPQELLPDTFQHSVKSIVNNKNDILTLERLAKAEGGKK